LAVLLFGLFAVAGFYKGATRMAVSLIGLFVAILLARPLSPMVKPLIPLVGLKNPIWVWLLPPVVIFLVLSAVFIGLSFFAHQKVALYYKYQTDDVTRLRWERVNQRLGVCMGLLAGAVYLFLLAWIIYVGGYLTLQIAAEESNPAAVRYFNQAREDLQKTGLDKSVAALDPTSPFYYEASDILGLIYHNPILQSRLSNYPPFLSLGERSEFQEIANDKEFNDLIFSSTKASITTIIQHPRVQAVLNNQSIIDELRAVDLKDLAHYLQTGKSPKYSDEKILGRWLLDVDEVITQTKKNPDMSAAELIILRKVAAVLQGATLSATLDNRIVFKLDPAAAQAAAPPPAPAGFGNGGGGFGGGGPPPPADPYQGRYGIRPSAPTPAPPPPTPVAAPQSPYPQLTGEGTWKRVSDRYELTVPDAKGKQYAVTGRIEDDELTLLVEGGQVFVFVRSE
ncbi:MAG: CvpA family protein, partial [Chloroflexi bacterium]|nr:CvpA family protein [Chloroflexota bacterium]